MNLTPCSLFFIKLPKIILTFRRKTLGLDRQAQLWIRKGCVQFRQTPFPLPASGLQEILELPIVFAIFFFQQRPESFMTSFGMFYTFGNAITPLTPNCFSKTNCPVQSYVSPFLLSLVLVAHPLRMVMQFWAIPLSPLQVLIAQLGIVETYAPVSWTWMGLPKPFGLHRTLS